MPDFLKMSSPEVIDFLEQGQKPRERTAIVEVESPARDKIDTLIDLLKSLNNGKVIIFVNHRESAVRVFDHLKKAGLPVGLYHGALDQPDREKAIDLLNNGTTPILVSTDLDNTLPPAAYRGNVDSPQRTHGACRRIGHSICHHFRSR